LVSANLWPDGPPAALSRATSGDPRAAFGFGLATLLLIPIVGIGVDRDPGLYFTARYWGIGQTWTWVVGSFVAFPGGSLTYRAFSDARLFAQLARSLPAVDLLDREALIPFARQGLRVSVPGAIFVTFFALNLVDAGFVVVSLAIGAIVLVMDAAMMVF